MPMPGRLKVRSATWSLLHDLAARGEQVLDALGLRRRRDVVAPERVEQLGGRHGSVSGKLIVVFCLPFAGNRAFSRALSMHAPVGVFAKSPCCS